MTQYNKITALYSRLSVGDEDRDGGESNSIVNQKAFLERYARQEKLTNIRHYIDDDESGRFFDRSAYVRMMDNVESGKIGIVVMKDMTRWGRDYLQVGNAMEIFRRNRVRFIAVNNGIDSEKPDTLEFAPFINIMSEWYAKDISKKVKTGIKTKGMSGKPIATEPPMAGLEEKVEDMYGAQRGIAEELKPIDRRLKTLDEHISNAEKYFQYRDIYRQYKQQKPKKQEAFYESHRMELTHYEAAERYLNAVMNGKTGIPLKAWKTERDKLNGEKKQLTGQYYALKDEVKEVEQIRRNVYSILREENGRKQPTRKHEIER